MRPHECDRRTSSGRAFTLVELLVVIGIIAILIAILLPVLSRARQAGNRVKCLANLREMVRAAHLHASEHQGYMPVAGIMPERRYGNIHLDNAALGDPEKRRYLYWNDSDHWYPTPLYVALTYYKAGERAFPATDRFTLIEIMKLPEFRQTFACPSDEGQHKQGFSLADHSSIHTGSMGEASSYVFNGFVLSMGKAPASLVRDTGPWCPAGKLTEVRRASEVFLFADGVPDDTEYGYSVQRADSLLSESKDANDATLYDYWRFAAGKEMSQFDHERHRNKINIAFVDGHADTVDLPVKRVGNLKRNAGGLDHVNLTRGVAFR